MELECDIFIDSIKLKSWKKKLGHVKQVRDNDFV